MANGNGSLEICFIEWHVHPFRAERWYEIWELNKGRIADPNLIEVGWELLLPSR